MSRPTLQVILASTRPGRIGKPLAAWLVLRAEELGLFNVELVDLAVVCRRVLDRLGVEDGMRVADLGCGTGTTTLNRASLVSVSCSTGHDVRQTAS